MRENELYHQVVAKDPNFEAIERAFLALLSRNKFYGGEKPDYGVQVVNVSQSGHEVTLELIFKSGVRYCCTELGCHLSFNNEREWARLHQALNLTGAEVVRPLTLSIQTVVQSGVAIMDKGKELENGNWVPIFRMIGPENVRGGIYDFCEAEAEDNR